MNPLVENLINRAVSRVLALDPQAEKLLAPFDGKRLRIVLESPPVSRDLVFGAGTIGLAAADSGVTPDLTCHTSLSSLRRLMAEGADTAAVMSSGMKIDGDAILAQRLVDAVRKLRLDWEELLAGYIGDFPARQISRATDAGREFAGQASERLRENMRTALLYEFELLVRPEEMERFADDVDDLRARVDRLEQRIGAGSPGQRSDP